ncbi:ATP-dependent DNA helicase RecG [Marispirochaeta aestuarii]|uniref:ATP-dependent DNA helicase RecG n=1 Tax=Marispirochaeta aestuarii TaxID=1963862 RepID=UPI002ABE898B|nr:ATP-dependent DNA helicase RecG [Marispirochaeta aestuarii]
MFLRELRTQPGELKGIGPRTAEAFASLGIESLGDLLLHAPRYYEDRKTEVPLSKGVGGSPVNTTATVIAHDWFGFGRKRTLKVWIEDSSGRAALNCFGRNFLQQKLPVGAQIRIYGQFSYRFGEIQASAFEFEASETPAGTSSFGTLVPIYPAGASLRQGSIRKAIHEGLAKYIDQIEDELPPMYAREEIPVSKKKQLQGLHFPETLDEVRLARRALAWEEFFYLQLSIARRGLALRSVRKERTPARGALARRVLESLPFELTRDQKTVLREIREDLRGSRPMARLIQGDVGSGKTLTAFLAACESIEAGEQAAFMAPTELLARQHAENAARLLEPAGVRLALLTGSVQSRAREEILSRLESGEIDLLIGTHALFSEGVRFRCLGLAIIDEQQRFGVLQRVALSQKGDEPDTLVMTATPIPRTLAMTVFGDLDVSVIRSMPPGRKPVITHLARMGREEKVYEWLKKEVRTGRQAYCVYPLIAESSKMDLKDAEGMYEALKLRFPDFRLGLIHSRLDEEEKVSVMRSFSSGQIDILVSTSVVEVGVDVPNATCMVVEHAERFGLAALHQLRGRVGRGEFQSYMFLVYAPDLSEEGKRRLKVMMENSDGFAVAEEDLKIRGPGNMTGTEQAGFLRLRFADPAADGETMLRARNLARKILQDDPGLLKPENSLLRQVINRTRPFEEELINGG